MKILLFLFLPFSFLSQNETIKDLHSQFLKDSLAYISFEKEHGKYIQTENVNMHYLEWGNPKNPTLVWIHGTYSNGTEIIEFVDSLVNSGIHIIAIDYYGHGKTEIPKKEVSLYNVADDIKFLLDSKKINTIELKKQQFYKPATCNLFNQSTFFMLPEVIYRNLKTQLLIIDPLKDDSEGFFSFSDEYLKLQTMNPSLVKLSKYNEATHAVIFEEPIRLQNEIINFVRNQ